MKAVAYLRVSSKGQAKNDRDGFLRQMNTIEKYAKAKRIEVVDVYQDVITGRSGWDDRPEMARMLDRIESNGVDTVLVENSSRLARDAMYSEILFREFAKRNITLILCESGTEYSKNPEPAQKMIRTIFAAFDEFEASMITYKLKAARDRHRKTKKVEGQKAYAEIDGKEKEVKELMIKLRRKPRKGKRLSYQGIADELNGRGIYTRSGKPWLSNGVRQVLVA